MAIPYRVVRSRRRTIAIQITPDGQVVVRCPYGTTERRVAIFINSKLPWIEKHLAQHRHDAMPLSEEQLSELTARAKIVIADTVAYFAPKVGVTYGRITIRHQRTRWGSCSQKGNLNFNCLLMLVPPQVLDYVVVHELCHRKELNHSKAFWAEVGRVCPDYLSCRKWLRENGSGLIAGLY